MLCANLHQTFNSSIRYQECTFTKFHLQPLTYLQVSCKLCKIRISEFTVDELLFQCTRTEWTFILAIILENSTRHHSTVWKLVWCAMCQPLEGHLELSETSFQTILPLYWVTLVGRWIWHQVIFFLWAILNQHWPTTLQALKAAIMQESFIMVLRDMVHRSMQNFQNRLQYCINIDSLHLTDVIYKI